MSTVQFWSRPDDGTDSRFELQLLVDRHGGVLIEAELLGDLLMALGWTRGVAPAAGPGLTDLMLAIATAVPNASSDAVEAAAMAAVAEAGRINGGAA